MKSQSWRYTCTLIFIAVLFTIAKKWKHVSIDRWMDKEVVCVCVCIHTYTIEWYSTIKEKKSLPFMKTWMNLKGMDLTKWNKSHRERQILLDLTYIWNQKTRAHRKKEQIGGCQGLWCGGNGEVLVKGYKLPVRRWISSGDLMYSIVTIVNNTVCYTWSW